MKHKQDRHNCSVLLNLKLFLANLSEWRIHISGSHLPIDSPTIWQPPAPEMQKMGEDVKDVIFKYYGKESISNIAELLIKQNQLKGHDQNTSKKRVSYFVSSMKKRRRERDYAIVESCNENESKATDQIQHELVANSNHWSQLKQLSDQQIIDVLRDETDEQAVRYSIVNAEHSEVNQFQCQLQPTVELGCEQSEIVFDTSHQHSAQELSVQYVDVNAEEGNMVQYQTVSSEPTAFITKF